jgi:hypothetical protein
MIKVFTVLWDFIVEHFWTLAMMAGVLTFGRTLHKEYIHDPLSGPDGKIQMDELAKGIVMGILIWSVYRDGYRLHEWPYFSDGFYAALLAGIFAIAAIKPIANVLNARYNGQNKSVQNTASSNRSTIARGDDSTNGDSHGEPEGDSEGKGTV